MKNTACIFSAEKNSQNCMWCEPGPDYRSGFCFGSTYSEMASFPLLGQSFCKRWFMILYADIICSLLMVWGPQSGVG